MKALVSLMFVLAATTASADESMSKILSEKQIQQNLSNAQQAIAGAKADEAFRARIINQAAQAHQAQMTALASMPATPENKALKAKLSADYAEKIALMRELDPKTLQELMIADIQEAQTSGVYMFYLTQQVADHYGRRDNSFTCHSCGAVFGTIFFPVVLALDLVSLPFTFMVSAFTGF